MTAPDLPAFLLARIAEVERRVANWDSDARCRIASMWVGDEPGYTTVASASPDTPWVADGKPVRAPRHVEVLWDPARVLAECAALRLVVDLHHHESKGPGPELYDGSRNLNEGVFGCAICSCVYDDPGYHFADGWCDTLLALAQPFADHPAFDPAWRLDD